MQQIVPSNIVCCLCHLKLGRMVEYNRPCPYQWLVLGAPTATTKTFIVFMHTPRRMQRAEGPDDRQVRGLPWVNLTNCPTYRHISAKISETYYLSCARPVSAKKALHETTWQITTWVAEAAHARFLADKAIVFLFVIRLMSSCCPLTVDARCSFESQMSMGASEKGRTPSESQGQVDLV